MSKSVNIDLNAIWKDAAQKYDLNKRDYLLWCISNESIFSIFSKILIKEREYYLDVICKFKPMWADEIFWKIIDSKSLFNYCNEPTSYRVIGSNVAPMKRIYMNQIKLSCPNTEEIQKVFNSEIEKILEILKNIDESDYTITDEVSIINIITAINNKDYKKARIMLKKISSPFTFHGKLKKLDKDINTWIFKRQALKYIRFKR